MGAQTSGPISVESFESLDRPELVFRGVEQAGPSFEGRVFLNQPDADEATATSPEAGYAGSFHVYGYGEHPPPALADEQGDAEGFEGERLLYVAATRARDHLVVGLHHSTRGQPTPARRLWTVCHDSASGWWKPAEYGDQLTLPVEGARPSFTPVSDDERSRWLHEHERMLAAANERRVYAATAVAALDHLVADDDRPASLASSGTGVPTSSPRNAATRSRSPGGACAATRARSRSRRTDSGSPS